MHQQQEKSLTDEVNFASERGQPCCMQLVFFWRVSWQRHSCGMVAVQWFMQKVVYAQFSVNKLLSNYTQVLGVKC